jgi:hypothetical protein
VDGWSGTRLFFLYVKSHRLDHLNTIKYDTLIFNKISLWDKHSLGIWLPSLGKELPIILCLWSLSIVCYFQPSFLMNKWIWKELWVVDWKVQGTIWIGYEGTWRHFGFKLNVFFCHETSLLWNWLNNQLQLLSGKNECKMKPILQQWCYLCKSGDGWVFTTREEWPTFFKTINNLCPLTHEVGILFQYS